MGTYIHELKKWPQFTWDHEELAPLLGKVRHKQGRLLGYMQSLGFPLKTDAMLETLELDVLKSSEIEGEILNPDQVRSSLARHLGIKIAGLVPSDRNVDGVVEMMLDATQKYNEPLTKKRLFNWHTSLFPKGKNSMYEIKVGKWRDDKKGAMQVVSGPMGRERVHYQAPDADILNREMKTFLNWFNSDNDYDPVLKAAVAHLWFVTVHPFDDGNGRIARAIADMQLARADADHQRFYSMSAQIRKERNAYYNILEKTQRGKLDITNWMKWFLNCLDKALMATEETLAGVLGKARFWEKHKLTPMNERQRLMLNKWLDGFEGKLTSSKWAKIAKCSADTALRDIQDLINKDILEKEEKGGRSTNYLLKNE
jgi:Fic family protein